MCFARLKLGFSETPALNSSHFPVNYRCFTLALVKLSERGKLWPQFVKEGGTGEGLRTRAEFGYSIVVLDVQTVPFPLNTSSFQSFTRKAHIVFQNRLCVFVARQLAHSSCVCHAC